MKLDIIKVLSHSQTAVKNSLFEDGHGFGISIFNSIFLCVCACSMGLKLQHKVMKLFLLLSYQLEELLHMVCTVCLMWATWLSWLLLEGMIAPIQVRMLPAASA
jgi:hypothetical protein